MEILLTSGQAANLLGIDKGTLRRWAERGFICPLVTPGNHRRYRVEDLKKLKDEMVKRPITDHRYKLQQLEAEKDN